MNTSDFGKVALTCLLPALFVSLPLMTGCGNSEKNQGEQIATVPQQELEEQFGLLQSLASENKWNDALQKVDLLIADVRYSSYLDSLLSQKISFLLSANELEKAKAFSVEAWKKHPTHAPNIANQIFSFFFQQKMFSAALAWSKELTGKDSPVPENVRNSFLFQQIRAAIALKDAKEASAVILQIPITDEPSKMQLESILAERIEKGDADLVNQIISPLLEGKDKTFFLPIALRCNIAQKQWSDAEKRFQQVVKELPDEQLVRACRIYFTAAKKGGVANQAEAGAKMVIESVPEKIRSAKLSARIWVDCGIRKDMKELPTRLDFLLNAKIDPNQVGDLLDQYFYRNIDDQTWVKDLCERGAKLIPLCTDTNTVNALKVKILDGSFITENYATAVSMLEKGIPGKDETWHKMSIPKVKAHLALKQNNPREAVRWFREFMNIWKEQKQEEEFDPTTGIAYSKEWILGRNALRVAKILESIPDKAEAAKAKEEAKGYFKIAKEKAAKDPEAMKLLNQETTGL